MQPSRRIWIRVLAVVAVPLIVVVAIVLAVLAALAFYVRAVVLAIVHPFLRRHAPPAEPPGESLAGPHPSAAARVVPGKAETSTP